MFWHVVTCCNHCLWVKDVCKGLKLPLMPGDDDFRIDTSSQGRKDAVTIKRKMDETWRDMTRHGEWWSFPSCRTWWSQAYLAYLFLKNASKRMRARAGSCALTEQALGATWYWDGIFSIFFQFVSGAGKYCCLGGVSCNPIMFESHAETAQGPGFWVSLGCLSMPLYLLLL